MDKLTLQEAGIRKDLQKIPKLPNKGETGQKIEELVKSRQEYYLANQDIPENRTEGETRLRTAKQLSFCFQTYVYKIITDMHLTVLERQNALKTKDFSFLFRKEEILREADACLNTAGNMLPLLTEKLQNEQEYLNQNLEIEGKIHHKDYLKDLEQYRKNPQFLSEQRTDILAKLATDYEVSPDLAARSASLFTVTGSAEDFAIMGEISERTVHTYFQKRREEQLPSKKDSPRPISLESIRRSEEEILFFEKELSDLKTEAIPGSQTELGRQLLMKRMETAEKALTAKRKVLYENTLGKFYCSHRPVSPSPSVPSISLAEESAQAEQKLEESRKWVKATIEKLSSADW